MKTVRVPRNVCVLLALFAIQNPVLAQEAKKETAPSAQEKKKENQPAQAWPAKNPAETKAAQKAPLQEPEKETKIGATLKELSREEREKKAWEILRNGAKEKDRGKRSRAVDALGLLPPRSEVVELAESALVDGEAQVRAAAALALGEMRSTKSVPKLVKAAEDEKISVALAAARSLLLLKNNLGYEVYYEVLTGERKGGGMIGQQLDELKDPMKAAEFALEQGIGFIPFAAPGYEAIQMLTKKDPSPVRAAAARALADDPDPLSSKALLVGATDKNIIVRVAVMKAIAKRGDPTLIKAAAEAMDDAKEEVRYAAAAATLRLTWGGKVRKSPGQ
ncbi:MAG TPA: HEAT repeat domain-containing protein [Candidatus Dormibacteraeota bacterium]|nr:HEAT repeat domain-containing protein [Candidatus Dormibacteraeota bacterium]